MNRYRLIIMTAILPLSLMLVTSAQSQEYAPYPAYQEYPIYQTAAFERERLDQIMAPIALYPDSLLSQLLVSATYPQDIMEASRWLDYPPNANLRGRYLDMALDNQNWDPSVKNLVSFPQIIQMMSENLEWVNDVGTAFMSQQADLMNSVQRLRHQAQAAGYLVSTPEQIVRSEYGAIIIEQAQPELVYVPVYNPVIVYGAWHYPSHPPFYFRTRYFVNTAPHITFFKILIANPFRSHNNWDWRNRSFHEDERNIKYRQEYYNKKSNRSSYNNTPSRNQHDDKKNDKQHKPAIEKRTEPTHNVKKPAIKPAVERAPTYNRDNRNNTRNNRNNTSNEDSRGIALENQAPPVMQKQVVIPTPSAKPRLNEAQRKKLEEREIQQGDGHGNRSDDNRDEKNR